ncbi:MAG: TPM domain-containing protein [Candidatus Eremiobacteraeota bacterium]|nr:TPM domain-containing protein [Candidatus Eremiobacteraeota bacterium]MBV8435740.1 TPM domain-containing protein [Candidatus Eremiobacteraeota bacterium]MBV8654547.1 TPM domain-containing protein [Candidatus Eremiobacteraeota bacterium]
MTREERNRIARAIETAESGTTGRIAVRVIPDRSVDAFERAKHEFGRTGLDRHDAANAALVLVAPRAKQYAVLGDRALHDRVGDAFWQSIVDDVRPIFARGEIADAVVAAVGRIGDALHEHFALAP